MLDNKVFASLIKKGSPTGEVISLNSFTAVVSTIPEVKVYSVVLFSGGAQGVVWQINDNSLDILLLNDTPIYANELVVLYKEELQIAVGNELLGRIINPLGKPLDGKGFISAKKEAPYFRAAPSFKDRGPVEDPLESGVTIVDVVLPLVKGQRMAVMGDSKSGKTGFMTQVAIHRAKAGEIVVYVLVAKPRNELSRIVQHFKEAKVLKNIIIVVADTSEPLPIGILAPYAGCAIAENFWHNKQDVLVVYDDFTNHAKIYREMALLLNQNVGREAYPGNMFHVHSALLERAGKLGDTNATQTVLVAGSTPNNDLTDYQATSLISMSDGQIVFDTDAMHQGVRPAINTELSVSRVGGGRNAIITHELTKSVIKSIGRYKKAKEMTSFIDQISETSRQEVALGERIFEAMQQSYAEYFSFYQERVMLEVILRCDNPSSLDVNWLKAEVAKISQEKTFTSKQLDVMIADLLKASAGPA